MDQVSDFFTGLLSAALWPARWYCGTWTDFHGWLYILSSLVICSAYFLIPISLFYVLIKRKKDLPFPHLFTLFSLFILSCGITHFFDAIVFWVPLYRLHALFLFITAVVSSITVVYLYKVLPYALTFTSPQQLEKVVEQRTQELAKKNSDLLKLNKEMDNFVYKYDIGGASLYFNNISGLVNILKMEIPQGNASVDELLDRIESSSTRAIDAIHNLTGILKVHTEPYDDLENIQIQNIVEEVLEENTILVKENQAIIRYELNASAVFFSRTALKSILYNLIINAIKYKSQDRQPEIIIRSFPFQDKAVEIQVADNGLGIDLKANGEKVFCLFKRFHDHIEGSGVGLYTVKKIIESKGGSVSIESTVNVGSTFKLILPQ